MNIFPRSTCRWSNAAALFGLAVFLASVALLPGAPPVPPRRLPPFLDQFQRNPEPPVTCRIVTFPSATEPVSAQLARPDTAERLPAVLLIPSAEGLTDWFKESARELAGVGYVTLAVDLPRRPGALPGTGDERTLAELSAGVRWLRRRSDVLPGQVGIAGWGWGGGQALSLATSMPVQACVVCDGPVKMDPALLARLGGTPLLELLAGRSEAARADLPAFRKALAEARLNCKIHVCEAAEPGFMGPPNGKNYHRESAETAWVVVYEFLGKHVEDAPQSPPAARTEEESPIATIADLMRAVNEATGVRGGLIRELEQEPAGERPWQRVRANAAVLGETGRLLAKRTPPKGTMGHWRSQAETYTAAAQSIRAAAERRDYKAALRGMRELDSCCMACHRKHR